MEGAVTPEIKMAHFQGGCNVGLELVRDFAQVNMANTSTGDISARSINMGSSEHGAGFEGESIQRHSSSSMRAHHHATRGTFQDAYSDWPEGSGHPIHQSSADNEIAHDAGLHSTDHSAVRAADESSMSTAGRLKGGYVSSSTAPYAEQSSGSSLQDYSRTVAANSSLANPSSNECNDTSILLDVPGYVSASERWRLMSADPVCVQYTSLHSLKHSLNDGYDVLSSIASQPLPRDLQSRTSGLPGASYRYSRDSSSSVEHVSPLSSGEAMRAMLDHKLSFSSSNKASAENYDAKSVHSTETEYQMLPAAVSPLDLRQQQQQQQRVPWVTNVSEATASLPSLSAYATPPLRDKKEHTKSSIVPNRPSPMTPATSAASLCGAQSRHASTLTDAGQEQHSVYVSSGKPSWHGDSYADGYMPMDPFSDTSCVSTRGTDSFGKVCPDDLRKGNEVKSWNTSDSIADQSGVSCGSLSDLSSSNGSSDEGVLDNKPKHNQSPSESASRPLLNRGTGSEPARAAHAPGVTAAAGGLQRSTRKAATSLVLPAPDASALVASRLDHIEAMVMKALQSRQPSTSDDVLQRSISETIRQMQPGVSPPKPMSSLAGQVSASTLPLSVALSVTAGQQTTASSVMTTAPQLPLQTNMPRGTYVQDISLDLKPLVYPLKDVSLNLSLLPDRTMPAFPAFSSATNFLSEQLKYRTEERTPCHKVPKETDRCEKQSAEQSNIGNLPASSTTAEVADGSTKIPSKGALPHLQPGPRRSSMLSYGTCVTMDDSRSMTTTVESTHTDSDDAQPPRLPSEVLGSRFEPTFRAPGIYGSRRKKNDDTGVPSQRWSSGTDTHAVSNAVRDGNSASQRLSTVRAAQRLMASNKARQSSAGSLSSSQAEKPSQHAEELLRLRERLMQSINSEANKDHHPPGAYIAKATDVPVDISCGPGPTQPNAAQHGLRNTTQDTSKLFPQPVSRPQGPALSDASSAVAEARPVVPCQHLTEVHARHQREPDRHLLSHACTGGKIELGPNTAYPKAPVHEIPVDLDKNSAAKSSHVTTSIVTVDTSEDELLRQKRQQPMEAKTFGREPAGTYFRNRADSGSRMPTGSARPLEHSRSGAWHSGPHAAASVDHARRRLPLAEHMQSRCMPRTADVRRTRSSSPARPQIFQTVPNVPSSANRSRSASPSPTRLGSARDMLRPERSRLTKQHIPYTSCTKVAMQPSVVTNTVSQTTAGTPVEKQGSKVFGKQDLRTRLADVIKDRQLTYRVLIEELTNAEDATKRYCLNQAWEEVSQQKRVDNSLSDEKLERLCDLLRNPLRHLVTRGNRGKDATRPSNVVTDKTETDTPLETLRSTVMRQKAATEMPSRSAYRNASQQNVDDAPPADRASLVHHHDEVCTANECSSCRLTEPPSKQRTTAKQDGSAHYASLPNSVTTTADAAPVKSAPAMAESGKNGLRNQAVQTSFASYETTQPAVLPVHTSAHGLRIPAPAERTTMPDYHKGCKQQDAVMWYQPLTQNKEEPSAFQKARQHFRDHQGCSWFVPLGQPKPWKRSPVERRASRVGREPWFPHVGVSKSTDSYGYSQPSASDHGPYSTADRRILLDLDRAHRETGYAEYFPTQEDDVKQQVYSYMHSATRSLQDAFLKHKQDFVSRSRERLRRVALRSEERAITGLHDAEREKLFGLQAPLTAAAGEKLPASNSIRQRQTNVGRGNPPHAVPFQSKPQRSAISKGEMYERTRRMCVELPEERHREVVSKRRQECAAHRSRARHFNKKVLHTVLRKAGLVKRTRK